MDSLTNFMNRIIDRQNDVHTPHLLKALPLLHFVREDCGRNEQLVLLPADIIKWKDPTIKLATMKYTIRSKTK